MQDKGIDVEEWRWVVGYEGLYEVSSWGRIKRVRDQYGNPISRILKSRPSNEGYHLIILSKKGVSWGGLVSRIVVRSFFGSIPPGMEAHHKDHDPSNNRADNLQIVTRDENMNYAHAIGHKQHGVNHWNVKLTTDQVQAVRQLEGIYSRKEIGAKFGISPITVRDIHIRRRWHHLPG